MGSALKEFSLIGFLLAKPQETLEREAEDLECKACVRGIVGPLLLVLWYGGFCASSRAAALAQPMPTCVQGLGAMLDALSLVQKEKEQKDQDKKEDMEGAYVVPTLLGQQGFLQQVIHMPGVDAVEKHKGVSWEEHNSVWEEDVKILHV